MIRTAPKQCGFKTESSGPRFTLYVLGAYSSGVRSWKSRQNLTEKVLSRTDEKRQSIPNNVGIVATGITMGTVDENG